MSFLRFTLATMLALLVPVTASSSSVKLLRTASQSGFQEGELEEVSVDALGTLRLAARVERVAEVSEPFVLTATRGAEEDLVLGTGNSGRVLRVTSSGDVSELFAVEEPEVFAVLFDEGVIYAGSSPDGKVYRFADGALEVLFDPEEKYIWTLDVAASGELLVGTGTQGKLFAVDTSSGEGREVQDFDDAHVRSVLVDGDRTLVGTAGKGLLFELTPSGLRTLHDATGPEIVALTAGPDGSFYAAALASEASRVDLSAAATAGAEKSGSESATPADGTPTVGSRTAGFKGPRSEVLRIDATGRVHSVWKFQRETVYSLLYSQERLWVATGQAGKLFGHVGEQMALEKDADESQVIAVLEGAAGPSLVTTNGGAVYRTATGSASQGTITSKSLDTKAVSVFGNLNWTGVLPDGASVSLAARSGASAIPDATWSDWTAPQSGREVPVGSLPRARYVQWRLTLKGDGDVTPEVTSVAVSYRQENLKPVIDQLEVLDPGEIVVPSTFNASNQAFEPASPNRDGIFTTIGEPKAEEGRTKTLWKKGFRALRWKVTDPNDDELRYAISFRAEDGEDWLPLDEELDAEHHNFDSSVLPDGTYRFRLHASDEEDNPVGEGREAIRVSEPVVVDHTAPTVAAARRDGAAIAVSVEDALSPIREAWVSVDAQDWVRLESEDGLLDGRTERLRIESPERARLVLLRVMDAAYNVRVENLTSFVGR